MAYRTDRHTPTSVEQAIEQALQPGHFINYNAGWSFVSGLETVATQIAALIEHGHPENAVSLYELFIAGCYEKAEELDDSSGEFGTFVEGLFGGWIRAREAAGADPAETASALLNWIDDDPYGFCSHLERQAVTAYTPRGLAAFAQAVRARLDEAEATRSMAQDEGDSRYKQHRRMEILKAIYDAQRNVEAYLGLCAEDALTPADCEVVAGLYQRRGEPDAALTWVDRGLQLEAGGRRGSGLRLSELKRALLRTLGRAGEALELAWQEFQAAPSVFTYKTLMDCVPESERDHWHAKAMQAAENGVLSALIPLWLETQEVDRLVERLRRADEVELVSLSHYTTEPAATRLATSHPDVAAKLYRALGLRILMAKKSKYYGAAVSHFAQAKQCYEQATLEREWQVLVDAVRRTHGRKYGFMPEFERIVAGQPKPQEASFLERAQQRWRRSGKH
jgi:Family of unknown function (DUF6880)